MKGADKKMDEALASEYESGRGLRLLLKLGFVNERPEFGVDTRWSESGDCYVLKLFRDYGKYMIVIQTMSNNATFIDTFTLFFETIFLNVQFSFPSSGFYW